MFMASKNHARRVNGRAEKNFIPRVQSCMLRWTHFCLLRYQSNDGIPRHSFWFSKWRWSFSNLFKTDYNFQAIIKMKQSKRYTKDNFWRYFDSKWIVSNEFEGITTRSCTRPIPSEYFIFELLSCSYIGNLDLINDLLYVFKLLLMNHQKPNRLIVSRLCWSREQTQAQVFPPIEHQR